MRLIAGLIPAAPLAALPMALLAPAPAFAQTATTAAPILWFYTPMMFSFAGAVEAAVAGLPRDLDGWRVASVVLLRSSVVASGKGAWAAMVDHRVRVLAV